MLNRLHMCHLFIAPFLLTGGFVFLSLWETTFTYLGYSLMENIAFYERAMDIFLDSFSIFPKEETAGAFLQDYMFVIQVPFTLFVYCLWTLFLTAGWFYRLPYQRRPMIKTSLGWFVALIYYPLVLSGLVTISAIVIRFFVDLQYDMATSF